MSNQGLDFTKSSKEIILDLINRDNQRDLTFDEVSFSEPEVNPSNYPRNTNVVVSADDGGGYQGEQTMHYNRLYLGKFFENTTPIIIMDENPADTHEALSVINNTYNLGMSTEDIEFEEIAGRYHTFKAKPHSYVWLGEVEFEIRLTDDDDDIDLAHVLTNKTFQEFHYPDYDVNLDYVVEGQTLDGFTYPDWS